MAFFISLHKYFPSNNKTGIPPFLSVPLFQRSKMLKLKRCEKFGVDKLPVAGVILAWLNLRIDSLHPELCVRLQQMNFSLICLFGKKLLSWTIGYWTRETWNEDEYMTYETCTCKVILVSPIQYFHMKAAVYWILESGNNMNDLILWFSTRIWTWF